MMHGLTSLIRNSIRFLQIFKKIANFRFSVDFCDSFLLYRMFCIECVKLQDVTTESF